MIYYNIIFFFLPFSLFFFYSSLLNICFNLIRFIYVFSTEITIHFNYWKRKVFLLCCGLWKKNLFCMPIDGEGWLSFWSNPLLVFVCIFPESKKKKRVLGISQLFFLYKTNWRIFEELKRISAMKNLINFLFRMKGGEREKKKDGRGYTNKILEITFCPRKSEWKKVL